MHCNTFFFLKATGQKLKIFHCRNINEFLKNLKCLNNFLLQAFVTVHIIVSYKTRLLLKFEQVMVRKFESVNLTG